MVLADLGKQLNNALGHLNRAATVDDKVIEALLKDLCAALLQSDVNVKLVASLRTKIRAKIKADIAQTESAGTLRESNKKQIVQKAVFDELVALVDPGSEPYKPTKGKTNVLMAVGIQGAGKTTTCTKLAVHYQRKGFRTCLVCADTFRAGAFDQLKQNATKAKIPFYGSYTETDPVAIAAMGVAKFRKERFDLIIVDTSGRHKQESELFAEMVNIGEAVRPDMTIMVLDASIGQAAESQSKAFKDSSDFGAIIVTKLDGHAKGGGAISAVAATKTPIIFLGVGEHFNDLERFAPSPFISKLLGMGDMQGLFEHMQDVAMANPDKQKAMAKKLEQGKFALRDWREQLTTLMSMGSMSKIMGSIPGLSGAMEGLSDEDTGAKLKRMVYIMDSMRADELDSDGLIFMRLDKDGLPFALNGRALRVARGSGTSVKEVEELLTQARAMRGIAKMAGGMANASKQDSWAKAAQQMQANGQRPNMQQVQAMQKAMPPDLLRQMRAAGSPQNAEKVMKDYMAKHGEEGINMNAMMQAMMGGGGMPNIPGMPDMSQMMGMFGGGGAGGMPNLGALGKMMGM